MCRSAFDLRVRLPCHQGVNPGESEVATPVLAQKIAPIVALDDRKGGEDVTYVVAALGRVGRIEDAVEDEIERIELGAELEAAVFVPDEGRKDFASRIDMAPAEVALCRA